MDELAGSFSRIGLVHRAEYRNTYDLPGRSIAAYLSRSVPRRIADSWRALRPDRIHINKQNLEDGLDLLRAHRLSGIPGICTIHISQSAQYLRARNSGMRDYVSRRALERYPWPLTTVLENRRRDLVEFLGDSPRIGMIPNGVPLFDLSQQPRIRAEKRQELGIAESALLAVAVGRLVPQKRPMLFLEKAEQLAKAEPSAQFVWIGDGALGDEWDRWVAKRGLGSRIQRLAWRSDVPELLLAADLFMHTAEFEGLPLAILEALSAGLPCAITSNLMSEMPFLNGGNSISIADDDSWIHAVRDMEQRKAIATQARALAEAEFSYGRMAERYEELYC